MLPVVNLEEFHRLLLALPGIVDALDRRASDGPVAVRAWLVEAEGVLERNRMPAAGNIAALRARLDSASRGAVPDGLVMSGTVARRKVVQAVAAQVIGEAADLLASRIEADEARLDEADRLARQLTVAAQVKGMVNGHPSAGDHAAAVSSIWNAVVADPELGGGAVHLLSLVGPSDALIVMDR
ncbi:MAG: hypothetical protein R6W79_07735, partial [Acidimicrobiia bacterium]